MLAQEASSINPLPLEFLAEIFLLCLEGLRHRFQFDCPAEPRCWGAPLLLCQFYLNHFYAYGPHYQGQDLSPTCCGVDRTLACHFS